MHAFGRIPSAPSTSATVPVAVGLASFVVNATRLIIELFRSNNDALPDHLGREGRRRAPGPSFSLFLSVQARPSSNRSAPCSTIKLGRWSR